jgi:hypothetical protein
MKVEDVIGELAEKLLDYGLMHHRPLGYTDANASVLR